MILLGTGSEDAPGKTLETKELEDNIVFIANRHISDYEKITIEPYVFFPLF